MDTNDKTPTGPAGAQIVTHPTPTQTSEPTDAAHARTLRRAQEIADRLFDRLADLMGEIDTTNPAIGFDGPESHALDAIRDALGDEAPALTPTGQNPHVCAAFALVLFGADAFPGMDSDEVACRAQDGFLVARALMESPGLGPGCPLVWAAAVAALRGAPAQRERIEERRRAREEARGREAEEGKP